MDEVTLLLQEAYDAVRNNATKVTVASAKVEKPHPKTKGLVDPKDATEKEITEPKNVRSLLEDTDVDEKDLPKLIEEDDVQPRSIFDQLATRILREEYEDEEFDPEAEAPVDDEYSDEYGDEPYPDEAGMEDSGETVEVPVSLLDQIQSLIDQIRGGGEPDLEEELPDEDVPMDAPEDEIPVESKKYKIGGVVGKRSHPLMGSDSRQKKSTKKGDPKAVAGVKGKLFADKAKLKGADKPEGSYPKVANRRRPGDPLFKC